jgi:hypothetical protein
VVAIIRASSAFLDMHTASVAGASEELPGTRAPSERMFSGGAGWAQAASSRTARTAGERMEIGSGDDERDDITSKTPSQAEQRYRRDEITSGPDCKQHQDGGGRQCSRIVASARARGRRDYNRPAQDKAHPLPCRRSAPSPGQQ